MTSKGLEVLNRRNRILEGAKAGLLYKEIAAREGCGIRTVSRIAVKGGIRRREQLAGRKTA